MTIKTHGRMFTDNTVGITQLAVADGSQGQALVTDGSGTLTFATVGAGGAVGSSTYLENIFTGDGTTVTFTLSTAAPYEESILVFIDGVAQPTASFTLPTTTTITFSPAPGNGAAIRVCHLGIASSVGDNSISGAKIAMGGDVAGDVLYYNGTDYQRLGIGTALQTFRTNSAANAPEWVDAATASLPAVGAAGNVLTSDASNWSSQPPLGGVGGELVSMQVFTSDGSSSGGETWTRPAGVKRILVYLVGPGGTTLGSVSAGAGGGGCAISVFDVTNLASATVTIGNSTQSATFAGTGITTMTANSGASTASNSTTGGVGGTATGGQINITGGKGADGGGTGHAPSGGGIPGGPIGGIHGRGQEGNGNVTGAGGSLEGTGVCHVYEYSDVSASLVGEKLVSSQLFETTGNSTWTRPANITKIEVFVVGGGGNSSTSSSASGGAGGGGTAYAILDVTNLATAAITVGIASAGSTFVGATTLTGGAGADAADNTNGAGGTGTGGQISFAGANGQAWSNTGAASFDGGESWFGGKFGRGAQGSSPSSTRTGTAGCVYIKEYTDPSLVSGGSLVPAGVLNPYAGATAPAGWLLCFGQSISRTTYSTLFTAIGTTYGSASGTTFNLPDMRGRVAAGQDDMGGTSANRLTTPLNGDTLGAVGGNELQTTQASSTGSGAFNFPTAADADTIQPTIILNYIIKT